MVRLIAPIYKKAFKLNTDLEGYIPETSSSLLLSSLELSDTQVFEPGTRALLRTASHFVNNRLIDQWGAEFVNELDFILTLRSLSLPTKLSQLLALWISPSTQWTRTVGRTTFN